MELIKLAVGHPYPLKLTQTGEGAATQFLLTGGNLLQILLSGINSDELWALKKGAIKAGFIYEKGCLLWFFVFHDRQNRALFTFDCPFDATIIPRSDLALHSIENQNQRLAIEIHVIDERGLVRALRLVTLSNQMTVDFLSTVQDQLSTLHDRSVMQNWMQYPPAELIKKCKLEKLGEK